MGMAQLSIQVLVSERTVVGEDVVVAECIRIARTLGPIFGTSAIGIALSLAFVASLL